MHLTSRVHRTSSECMCAQTVCDVRKSRLSQKSAPQTARGERDKQRRRQRRLDTGMAGRWLCEVRTESQHRDQNEHRPLDSEWEGDQKKTATWSSMRTGKRQRG